MSNQSYFPHIDGLRALAVISVIVYHFLPNALANGLLGVDIFFVISGFVITGLITRSEKEHFMLNFYWKRLKRLAPALVACVCITSLCFLLLTTRPSQDIFQTAASSILGLSNIFLWFNSADYFALDTSLNPFTHTWSLGIEEQFYFIYPLLLLCLGANKQSAKSDNKTIFILSALCLISAGNFIFFFFHDKGTYFYLLNSRFWELGIGGLAFFLYQKGVRTPKIIEWISIPILLISISLTHSAILIATLGATSATIFILMSDKKQSLWQNILSTKPLLWIGLLSYSLYLWHWPILVLAKHTIGTSISALLIAAVLTIIVSTISYFTIEKPLRYKSLVSSKKLELTAFILCLCILAPALWQKAHTYKKSHNNMLAEFFNIEPVANWAPSLRCHGAAKIKSLQNPYHECLHADRTKSKPYVIYLVGDSHAAQLYFMFEKAVENSQYQLRFINDEIFPQAMVTKSSPSKSLDYIKSHIQPNDVIALAFHRGRLNEKRDAHTPLSEKIYRNEKSNRFFSAITSDLDIIEGKGGILLLIQDTPLMANIATSPSCKLQTVVFGESSCRVSLEQDLHTRKRQDMLYNDIIQHYKNSCIWDPLPNLYLGKKYFEVTNKQGEYRMLDWNHLTERESILLATPFKAALKSCWENNHQTILE